MASKLLDAVVVGGGPVGVYLGALLAHGGLDVQILERRAALVEHSRAIGIHPPALESFDRIGVTPSILAEGVRIDRGFLRSEGRTFGGLAFNAVSDRHPYIVSLPQHRTEALLAGRLDEIRPGALRRGVDVEGLKDEGDFVRLRARTASGTDEVRARVVVGADGGSSFVRGAAGIGVRRRLHRDTYLMGDFTDTTEDGTAAVIWLEPGGVVESFPLPGGLRRWVVHSDRPYETPTAKELSDLIEERTGIAVDPAGNTMISGFGVRTQPADRMVAARTILVGDAAHQVSPIGGQGMNLGWLDAAALAPILIEAARTGNPDELALARFEQRRMRSATVAANMARINMAMGRPVSGFGLRARDLLLQALLTPPVRGVLARAYSMRWL
ncbi:FAD-dependent oxidoreductase [Arthrobacter monumenti]